MADAQPSIQLFELSPTRSARARWMLQEAGLTFESIGNEVEIIGSERLRAVHPLGKLPAVVIDGQPLFESAAIVTAIADLVPERALIPAPGSWARNLHYQWMSFVLTEMEAHLQSAEINTIDFVLEEKARVPDIVPQCQMLFGKAAKVLDAALADAEYLVNERFSAVDVIAGYTMHWAEEDGLLAEFANLQRYLARLQARPGCPLAMASVTPEE